MSFLWSLPCVVSQSPRWSQLASSSSGSAASVAVLQSYLTTWSFYSESSPLKVWYKLWRLNIYVVLASYRLLTPCPKSINTIVQCKFWTMLAKITNRVITPKYLIVKYKALVYWDYLCQTLPTVHNYSCYTVQRSVTCEMFMLGLARR